MVLGFTYSLIACGVLTLFGRTVVLLFVDAEEAQILTQAHQYLKINSASYVLLTLVNVIRFCIQGLGYSTFAIIAGICEMIARALIGFGFVPIFGYEAVCFASPLAWVFADLFLIPAYFICMKRLRKMFGARQEERAKGFA